MILEVGNQLKERKQNEKSIFFHKNETAVTNSCDKTAAAQVSVDFVESFFRDMSSKACKTRINPAMKCELSIVCE